MTVLDQGNVISLDRHLSLVFYVLICFEIKHLLSNAIVIRSDTDVVDAYLTLNVIVMI